MAKKYSILIGATIFTILVCIWQQGGASAAKMNNTELAKSLQDLDNCMMKSVISFLEPVALPPKNLDELARLCKQQTESLKCLKEKSKNKPPLIKRGLSSFTQSRQRFLKKVCTDTNSEASKSFVRAIDCVLKNNKEDYANNDLAIVTKLQAIERRRYDDSKTELKYLCCAILTFKEKYVSMAKQNCAKHQEAMSDLISSIISSDISLLCTDEDKLLEETCPSLPPLTDTKTDLSIPASRTSLYLVATLGEP